MLIACRETLEELAGIKEGETPPAGRSFIAALQRLAPAGTASSRH